MERPSPSTGNDEIQLYIRTYFSLLKSSRPIRIRSLEEMHASMQSSLHSKARSPQIDMAAFVYAFQRLPRCLPEVSLVILGQMKEVFDRAGYAGVEHWTPVRAPARRRKMFFDSTKGTLAAFIASVSDIDDLVPCLVTFQIEWNKIHALLNMHPLKGLLAGNAPVRAKSAPGNGAQTLEQGLQEALELDDDDMHKLKGLLPGKSLVSTLRNALETRLDIQINVLSGSLCDYRRAVGFWWQRINDLTKVESSDRPVYFVSSNTHSFPNLVTGYCKEIEAEIIAFIEEHNPENLASELDLLRAQGNEAKRLNFLYYASRYFLAHKGIGNTFAKTAIAREQSAGLLRVADPSTLDVEAQIIELAKLTKDRIDPRLHTLSDDEWDALKQSDAVIFNIDYPLGMAAFHIFSEISSSIRSILGVYILGKAASLNGRVGDVMIPNVVYDEHSRNTYLFKNCFDADDLSPYLNHGTVLDNQKAVTVRGTILQNKNFMHLFYKEGYTDLEMEAGPYLSGIYEHVNPKRYPENEIVKLYLNVPYDVGFIHYASDTPISVKEDLLSKSLSYFGIDSTYAATVAVLNRVLKVEAARQLKIQKS